MATKTTTQNGPISDPATFGGSAFNSGDNIVAAHVLTIDQATVAGASPIGAPLTAPTAVKAAGGSLAVTTFAVRYSHIGVTGPESDLSPEIDVTTDASNKTINVTLPSLPTGVVGYAIYMNSGTSYFRQAVVAVGGTTAITTLSVATAYAPVYAVAVKNANGRLIVNANLTALGSISLEGTTTVTDVIVTQAAGTTVSLDNSASPNTAFGYQIFLGGFTNARRSIYWKSNGTVNSRCVLSHVSGAHGMIVGPTSEVGHVDFNFTDIIRFGSSVDNALIVQSTATAGTVNFTNCVLDTCGRIQLTNALTVGFTLTMVNTTFKNSAGLENFRMVGATTSPTALRKWVGCVSDQAVILSMVGLTIGGTNTADATLFLNAVSANSAVVRPPAALTNCLFRLTTISAIYRMGDWADSVCIADGNTMNGTGGYSAKADLANPHWTTANLGSAGTYAITNCIFESFGSDDTGDVELGQASGIQTTMSNCIALPEDRDSGFKHGTGTLCTLNGVSGQANTFNHNTWFLGGQGAIALVEAGTGFAGMCDELQSNIFWNDDRSASDTSTTFNRITYEPTHINAVSGGAVVANGVNATKTGHNCRYNLYTGAGTDTGLGAYTDGGLLGHSYHHYATSGTFGSTDITGNPLFIDSTVRFWTWVKSLAGSTLPGNPTPDRKDYMGYGLYKLALKNEPAHVDYDSRYTLTAYKTFIRAGMSPQNPLLIAAGHDGADIGAVAATPASAGSGGRLRFHRR